MIELDLRDLVRGDRMANSRALRAFVAVLLVLAGAGCVHGKPGISVSVPIPSSVLAESRTIDGSVPPRPGQLTNAQYDSVAPTIRALRATPPALSAEGGDTIRVADSVRIYALDSVGAVLGEMPYYDFAYRGRGFKLLADGRVVVGQRGTLTFIARLPVRFWNGRASARPSIQLPITIIPNDFSATPPNEEL